MNSPFLRRLGLVSIAVLFILTSCGSDEESSAAADATEAPSEETTIVVEPTSVIVDNRTEQEIAVDKLDLMMIQLGISELEDFESATSCVIERLESEGIAFTGEGTASLIALSACNKTVVSQWLPSTNPALPEPVWACTVENIGEWISELTIPEAEAFFAAASPPPEFIEQTAERCDASVGDMAAAF
jgi:hypothetical protein